MSKLVSYQGCLMESQTKIAIEALALKAERNHLTLNIRYAKENMIEVCGNEDFERSPICRFLQKEAPHYGFVQNTRYPWRFTFVGLKKEVPV